MEVCIMKPFSFPMLAREFWELKSIPVKVEKLRNNQKLLHEGEKLKFRFSIYNILSSHVIYGFNWQQG